MKDRHWLKIIGLSGNDFGFDKSGEIFILMEEIAPDVFPLEGNPGKAGDSFLFHKVALWGNENERQFS